MVHDSDISNSDEKRTFKSRVKSIAIKLIINLAIGAIAVIFSGVAFSREESNRVTYIIQFIKKQGSNVPTDITRIKKSLNSVFIIIGCDDSIYNIAETAKEYINRTNDNERIFATIVITLVNILFAVIISEDLEDLEDNPLANEAFSIFLYYYNKYKD